MRSDSAYARACAAALFVLLCVAAGALLAPRPDRRWVAEAAVAVHVDADASRPDVEQASKQRFAETLTLQPVMRTVLRRPNTHVTVREFRRRFAVTGSGGLIKVRARARTRAAAARLADTATAATVARLREEAVRSSGAANARTSRFDFEQPTGVWSSYVSRFNLAPRGIRVRPPSGGPGTTSLVVDCAAGSAGCGPAVPLFAHFLSGLPYGATVLVRSPEPARVRLVLGHSADDVAVSPFAAVGDAWKVLRVTWRPRRTSDDAEAGVQALDGLRSAYRIDDLTLLDPSGGAVPSTDERLTRAAARVAEARAVAELGRYSIVQNAQVVESRLPQRDKGALFGGLVGIAGALAGLGSAHLARSRRALAGVR